MAASEQPPTFTSAAELMAVGEAAEREAAARYGDRAATMAAAGNTEVAALYGGSSRRSEARRSVARA